jgi:hypothetical protein
VIPHDHFDLQGDTAWLVAQECDGDHRLSVGCHKTFDDLDQPCDTCGGTGLEHWRTAVDEFDSARCSDCSGGGRRSFDIEVSGGCICNGDSPPDPECPGSIGLRAYRASIVEVLPIHDDCPDMSPPDHVCHAYADEGWTWHRSFDHEDWTERPVVLPPAATPGMWAVKLNIARSNT